LSDMGDEGGCAENTEADASAIIIVVYLSIPLYMNSSLLLFIFQIDRFRMSCQYLNNTKQYLASYYQPNAIKLLKWKIFNLTNVN